MHNFAWLPGSSTSRDSATEIGHWGRRRASRQRAACSQHLWRKARETGGRNVPVWRAWDEETLGIASDQCRECFLQAPQNSQSRSRIVCGRIVPRFRQERDCDARQCWSAACVSVAESVCFRWGLGWVADVRAGQHLATFKFKQFEFTFPRCQVIGCNSSTPTCSGLGLKPAALMWHCMSCFSDVIFRWWKKKISSMLQNGHWSKNNNFHLSILSEVWLLNFLR